jgi:hypothetical protein
MALIGIKIINNFLMAKYLFQTSELGISDTGIHLLRSGFDYRTIKWKEINAASIEKGKELHNWWIIFILGAVLLLGGIYLTLRTIDILLHKEHPERFVKMLLFLLIPGIGIYFIYTSLRTGIVLKINYDGYKKDMFPLKDIIKENRIEAFRSLINEKIGTVSARSL